MCLMLRLLFALVVTTLLIVAVVQAEEENERMTMDEMMLVYEAFASNCDFVPTREQIEEFASNKKDVERETKCLRYCIMTQLEWIKEGSNQLNKEKIEKMLGNILPENKEAALELIDKCNQKNEAITDNCEGVHENSMCILDEIKASGINFSKVKKSSGYQ